MKHSHGLDLEAITRAVVEQARAGEHLEVMASKGTSTSVRAYEGEVESFTSADSFGLGIRVLHEGREGFAHAGSLDAEVVAATLAEARDNVAFAEPDPHAGLAEPDGVKSVPRDLWSEAVVRLPVQRKIDLALDLERRVRGMDPRITGVRTTVYSDGSGEAALASTNGIFCSNRSASCSVWTSPMATDGEETQIGGAWDAGRDPDALDLDRVATEAALRATRLLGATKPPSQRLTIVLEPELAADLLSMVSGMLSGEMLVKGRTPFADRIGERVAAPILTLVDDPTDGRSLGADEFDGEGLGTRRNVLVRGGVLEGFLHNAYTGRRSGVGSTAAAVRGARSQPGVGAVALAVEPGELDRAALLARVGEGFYVQSLAGLHSGTNPVSGDFSVGADGLMIRGGELAEPVRELTLASTVQRMLLDISLVGGDLEWLPSGEGMCTLAIDDVAMSGT